MKKIVKMYKGIDYLKLYTTYFILFEDNLKISIDLDDMSEHNLDSLLTNGKLRKSIEEFKVWDNYPIKVKPYPNIEQYNIWQVVKIFIAIYKECKDYKTTLYVFDSIMMFRERMKRGIYNDNDWQY